MVLANLKPSIRGTIMGRCIVLAGHITFAVITICLLALTIVEAQVQLSGGDILALTETLSR